MSLGVGVSDPNAKGSTYFDTMVGSPSEIGVIVRNTSWLYRRLCEEADECSARVAEFSVGERAGSDGVGGLMLSLAAVMSSIAPRELSTPLARSVATGTAVP